MSITFPVLRHLSIGDYGLFETNQSSGIDHKFAKGVHVIVGINGLGKTTLLNIIYRMMLGPKDMSKEDGGLSSTQHKLVDWRNKKYFRTRVRDEARSAWAEAIIGFGSQTLTVRRSLRTLEVQSLKLNGVAEAEASQDRYEALACELSGSSTYFDFFAVLRFLIFFLEDRPELIWDRRSQFDMFRLLFYDRVAAREAAEAYDEVQRIDSEYRNHRVPVREARRQLDQYDAAEQSGVASEIRAARRALAAAQNGEVEHNEAIEHARADYECVRLRREKARLDLEEARRAYEAEQELFYQHVFPDLKGTAEHVFLNLAAGGGCLVCGNRSAAAGDRLRAFAARHDCPICESHIEEQENVVSAAKFNQKRLEKVGNQVDELRVQLRALDDELVRTENLVREIVDARQESFDLVKRMQAKLNELQRLASADVVESVMSDDEEQIAFKRQYVEKEEARLLSLVASRTTAETRYKAIKSGQQQQLSARLSAVKSGFARIAEHLLAEKCSLREAMDTRRIGQEGEMIEFPILEVMMSSGVFTGSLSAREDATSVSESQREFIDLAFRMALMQAAASSQSDAMLVLETPEASLDSLFVQEAGALFRGFAAGGDSEGNVFIASTNLNNEGMIPALFGAIEPPKREPTAEADKDALVTDRASDPTQQSAPVLASELRADHLINLLQLSAPNAALRQHRIFYEEKLEAAVYSDLPAAQRPSLASIKEAPPQDGNAVDDAEQADD